MVKTYITDFFYLKCYIILIVIIVFFVEFIQNDNTFAEENYKKCLEFVDANNLDELKKLRLCIKKMKIEKELEKTRIINLNSYKGSVKLTEKLLPDNNTSKIVKK